MSDDSSLQDKKALLRALLLKKARAARGRERFPLSHPQKGLWLFQEQHPETAVYNVLNAVRLVGPLSVAGLEWAFSQVVVRHDILRTRFGADDDGPYQDVLSEILSRVKVVDYRGVVGARSRSLVASVGAAFNSQVFDLRKPPLWRIMLLRLSDRESVMLLSQHHIICDAFSDVLLVRDLAGFYRARLSGGSNGLTVLSMSYGEWVSLQQVKRKRALLQRLLQEALANLEGVPTLVDLPTDRARPVRHAFRGQRLNVDWDATFVDRLKHLSRVGKGSLYMTILAGFGALLHRHTHMRDFLIGSPNANRDLNNGELLGLFVNTTCLRLQPMGRMPFLDLIAQARAQLALAQAHREVPFEWLVSALAQRQASHLPLVQVACVFQNVAQAQFDLPLLDASLEGIHNGTAKFDLLLALRHEADGIRGHFEYNCDLFESWRIEALRDQLYSVLNAACDHPTCLLAHLRLVDGQGKQRLLACLNEDGLPEPPLAQMSLLFERVAARYPEQVALLFESQRLSYRDLDARANQLSHYLLKLGIRQHQAVPVCTGRVAALPITILAILKAGAVYVPIDPALPVARFRDVLEQVDHSPIVTTRVLEGSLAGLQHRLIVVEDMPQDIAATRPAVALSPMAYILFTSGSTGQPKGVMVGHRSVIQLFAGLQKRFRFDARDTWSLHHAYTFDVSVWEMWAPLLHGGRLLVLSEREYSDFQVFFELLQVHEVSVLSLTPAAFSLFSEIAVSKPQLGALRVIALAGDVLDHKALGSFFDHYGDVAVKLINLYGITETTVYITTAQMTVDHMDLVGSDIGRPVSGWQTYVLDGELAPMPQGVVGEIYVAGDGLAYGYTGRPGQTAERFIPNPFSQVAGDRLYVTGDLARIMPRADGVALDFIGRIDHQVQIRGYRIELGEIRETLLKHPLIREVMVIVVPDAENRAELCAFYVAGEALDDSEVAVYLNRFLPRYMHPAHSHHLMRLPLTRNGKVDRKALLEYHRQQELLPTEQVAPLTPMELALAAIWCELLKLDSVGVHDNFFDHGGHSLLATRLSTRVLARLGLNLPMAQVFAHPTIADQAAFLTQEGELAHGGIGPLPAIARSERGPAPLSFSQQRLWFLQKLEPHSTVYNIPFLLELNGHVQRDAFEASILWLIKRHASLRTSFVEWQGQPVQWVQPEALATAYVGNPVCVAFADFSGEPQRARDLIEAQFETAFDLETGPLFRVQLYRVAAARYWFGLCMHHIITDGWSTSIFVHDWCQAYNAYVQGREPEAAALRLDYSDYAQWQHAHITSDLIQKDLTYWQDTLRDAPSLIDLPTDRPRPALQSYQGAVLPFHLACGQSLKQAATARQQSLFMNLLAAYATTLHVYSQQDVIVIGTPNANRENPQIEGMIGFFVTTMTLAIRFRGEDSLEAITRQVERQLVKAMAHQYIAFDHLVEHLAPERSLSHAPIFQVMIAMPNVPVGHLEVAGLEIKETDVVRDVAPFDLTLDLREEGTAICGGWTYNTDLFDATTIEAMHATFERVVASLLADPATRLRDLVHPSSLIRYGDGVGSGSLCHRNVFECVDLAYQGHPEATAVLYHQTRISYGDFLALVNGYRQVFVDHQLRVGQVVAIYRPADHHLLAAMIAAFQAGLTYLPLDPTGNPDRLSFKLRDTNAGLILTQPELASSLSDFQMPIVCREPQPQETTFPIVKMLDLPAYIIYTSGSTGTPKGVVVSHRNLLNFLHWWNRELCPLRACLPIPMITNPIFDASFTQLLAPLIRRQFIWFPQKSPSREPVDFLHELVDQGEVAMDVVNSLWSFLLDSLEQNPELLSKLRLRLLMVGGEALTEQLLARTTAHFPGLLIGNNYGPTETSINASLAILREGDQPHLGQPVAHTQLEVVNSYGQGQAPRGAGELLIGGIGVSQGYHNRPSLTAEKFVPDPHSLQPGARRYRSGDKVRVDGKGQLQFVGRIDHQVKLRGFRIELGEIENHLLGHSQVSLAAVIVSREQQLVGFVVTKTDTEPEPSFRDHLKQSLPAYMIPTTIHRLAAMPLNTSAKTDRRALVRIHEARGEAKPLAPPESQTQKVIAAIWSELLKRSDLNLEDSFFDLGGHSLLLTKVQSQLQERFEVMVPIVKLFEYPTIASLAAYLDEDGDQSDFAELSKQRASTRRDARRRRQRRRKSLN